MVEFNTANQDFRVRTEREVQALVLAKLPEAVRTKISLPGMDGTFNLTEPAMMELLPQAMRAAAGNVHSGASNITRETFRRARQGSTSENEPLRRLMGVMMTVGAFTNNYIFSLMPDDGFSPEEVRDHLSGLREGYKEICEALIKFSTQPADQHTPLAAYLGQFFPSVLKAEVSPPEERPERVRNDLNPCNRTRDEL